MKTICLNLNIHKTHRLKKYDFFDIGHNNFYFDDMVIQTEAEQRNRDFVAPMFDVLFDLIEKYGKAFRFSITVSGFVLELLDKYYSPLLERYRALYETGCVEFVGMPYYHSL
jgi:alpha-amylase